MDLKYDVTSLIVYRVSILRLLNLSTITSDEFNLWCTHYVINVFHLYLFYLHDNRCYEVMTVE